MPRPARRRPPPADLTQLLGDHRPRQPLPGPRGGGDRTSDGAVQPDRGDRGHRIQALAIQSELGDYKLYTLPEPTTVAARQTKQVAFLDQHACRLNGSTSIAWRLARAPIRRRSEPGPGCRPATAEQGRVRARQATSRRHGFGHGARRRHPRAGRRTDGARHPGRAAVGADARPGHWTRGAAVCGKHAGQDDVHIVSVNVSWPTTSPDPIVWRPPAAPGQRLPGGQRLPALHRQGRRSAMDLPPAAGRAGAPALYGALSRLAQSSSHSISSTLRAACHSSIVGRPLRKVPRPWRPRRC